ncbi:MAG: hypothetical protein C4346_03845 [Chloroflexota bacterium]
MISFVPALPSRNSTPARRYRQSGRSTSSTTVPILSSSRQHNRREAIVSGWPLGAALAAVFLGAVDLTVIATVLPQVVFDLRINTADVDRYIWVVNAYLLAYIVTVPVMGRISDLIGRTAAFQIALAVFLAGSLWSATASNLTTLILARAVQGAGGGALLPVTLALVGDLLPPGRRHAAIGLVGAIDTFGWVLGPVWGAAVVRFAPGAEPWRWVFWINVPAGIVVAILIWVGARRAGTTTAPHRRRLRELDLAGTLLLGSALLLLNLGLSVSGEAGISKGAAMRALGGTRNPLAPYLMPLLGAGAALLILFILWERRSPSPILPLRLFQSTRFTTAIAANFLAGAALIVAMVDVPVVVALLADEERISELSAAYLAPFSATMAILSFTGGIVAGKRGDRRAAGMGLLLVASGYVAIWLGLGATSEVWMLPGLVVAGAGFGMVIAPIGANAIDAASAADRGIAAGLTILFRLLGMTIGISALTAFGVRRLQALTAPIEPVVREEGETTAEFFLRQHQYIQDVAIPLSLRVVRETFLIAAAIAVLALLPVLLMRTSVIHERDHSSLKEPRGRM